MNASTKDRPQGRIFKPRGCRYWYIQYYDVQPRETKSGRLTKRRTESAKSTSRSVAEQMLRDRLHRKDRGETILNPRKVMFSELEKLIKNDYATSGNRSLRRLKTSLKHLHKAFGADRAIDVTSGRWLAYLAQRQAAGAAASTIMAERAALHRMFTLAIQAERLASTPHFKRVRVENERPVEAILDDEEIAAILADEKYPEDLKGAFEFGALTGWRIPSEVWTLTWNRVDIAERVIRLPVGSTKNREKRELRFEDYPALVALLERWLAKRRPPSPFVFHRKGKPIAHKRAYAEWHEVCDRLEIRDKDAYTVRHAMTMRLDGNGVPLKVGMSITGHKSEKMYLRYRQVGKGEQEAALAKIAE
jgi:integrase